MDSTAGIDFGCDLFYVFESLETFHSIKLQDFCIRMNIYVLVLCEFIKIRIKDENLQSQLFCQQCYAGHKISPLATSRANVVEQNMSLGELVQVQEGTYQRDAEISTLQEGVKKCSFLLPPTMPSFPRRANMYSPDQMFVSQVGNDQCLSGELK